MGAAFLSKGGGHLNQEADGVTHRAKPGYKGEQGKRRHYAMGHNDITQWNTMS